jgi:hypothetical protein
MFGNIHAQAQHQRRRHGPGRSYEMANSIVPIHRKKWKTVELDTYAHDCRKFMWEPACSIYCPFCNQYFPVGSKHFSDSQQGCRSVLACEKIQHKFHLLANHHGHPKRWLSVSAINTMVSQGLNLETVHRQEELWLPNEPLFEFDNARNWSPTGFNICHSFDNLPQHLRIDPWPQDLSGPNNQDLMVFGPDVYASHRIRDRFFERISAEKNNSNDVVDHLIDAHDENYRRADRYRFQIANFKQHILGEVAAGNITLVQGLQMMNFFDMPGSTDFVPASNDAGGPYRATMYVPIPRSNIVTAEKTAANTFVNENLAYILGPKPTHM